MKTQVVTVRIKKDLMTQFQHEVYAHEVPVIEAAHPNGKVEVVDLGKMVEIDGVEEYERLMSTYGADEETGRPLVEEIYGRGGQSMITGIFEIDPNMVTHVPTKGVATPVPEPKKADINDLRETLKSIDVPFKKNMTAATLEKMVNAKRAEYEAIVADSGVDVEGLDLLELHGLVEDIRAEESAA